MNPKYITHDFFTINFKHFEQDNIFMKINDYNYMCNFRSRFCSSYQKIIKYSITRNTHI